MDTTEIKKELYKQKPLAVFTHANKSGLNYVSNLNAHSLELKKPIKFIVPFEDIGDGNFNDEIPAQLLIRYIISK